MLVIQQCFATSLVYYPPQYKRLKIDFIDFALLDAWWTGGGGEGCNLTLLRIFSISINSCYSTFNVLPSALQVGQ